MFPKDMPPWMAKVIVSIAVVGLYAAVKYDIIPKDDGAELIAGLLLGWQWLKRHGDAPLVAEDSKGDGF